MPHEDKGAADRIRFRAEAAPPDHAPPEARPWRILSADDDLDFRQALSFAVRDMRILGRPVELITVASLSEAARLLARDRDFAVILVDVVMETDDAGIRLVKAIRDTLGLQEPRIVMLTGQPGFAPAEAVLETLDLSDYCLKSDLSHRGLKNILTAAIRAYDHLAEVSAARRGLQMILEASNHFAAARSVAQLAEAALVELAQLLGVPPDGIVCVEARAQERTVPASPMVIGAAGRFTPFLHQAIDHLPEAPVAARIREVLARRTDVAGTDFQLIFVPRQLALSDYVIYIASGRPLERTERELVKVFAANASKGFGNVALISRLDRMAYEDELLHIPNRGALLREIETRRLQGEGHEHHLVLLDLDNFAGLNDAFGVELGNRILRALVAPLQQRFPAPAVVARISSDVFGIVGPAAQVTMARAAQVFDEPLEIDDERYRLTACVMEIALDAIDGDPAELLRAGWGMLHHAKLQGPGSRIAYDPHIEQAAGHRFALMSRLGQDLRREALFLQFQPQVDMASGRVVGAEALLRWRTDEGLIPPSEFIPIAEKSSYIHAIGDLVLRQACQALDRLAAAGLAHLVLSINLSARQFEDPNLIPGLLETCAAAGIAPGRLEVEVTETTAMDNFAHVSQALSRYRDGGNTVAIDDFGTGFSSLEYVYQLPADRLKIDQVFVARLEHDERGRQLVRLILDLARSIDATVIAEGVETAAQAEWLTAHGCHIGQGWLYARPMPLEALIDFCGAAGAAA
ncbi:EAL domain-containing protein [Nitrogeniibacter mangrovi]|uniref:EAL domain-containing protein n=1 Tax=Nitrogeniibacter mangrovi TaxID=2016596 RepID=A0A6C1BA20_9RHOO|nr:EAL domain-containing protein [Nitrogeniibacter mangrovi]QID19220.1 EAL domain-containing protein [Nitrogeniibacter mangrovi]